MRNQHACLSVTWRELVLAAFAALTIAIPFHSAGAEMPKFPPDSYMARIQARGSLNAAVQTTLMGIGYRNPLSGEYEGFTVDLMKNLAERIFGEPGHVTFKPAVPSTQIPMVTEGVADLTIGTMYITEERAKVIEFSEPYWESPNRIFVHKDNNTIQRLADLEGKTIAAPKGSATERNVREQTNGYPKAKLLLFDSPAEVWESIRIGRADANTSDEAIGLSMIKAFGAFKAVGDPIAHFYYGIGLKKGTGFKTFIDKWLTDIKKDGTWKKLYAKNLPGKVPEPPLPPYSKAFYQK